MKGFFVKHFIFLGMTISILFSSISHAGGTRIFCQGMATKMEILGKGPNPMEREIVVQGLSAGDTSLVNIFEHRHFSDYAFNYIYQSLDSSTNLVVILDFDGKNHFFSVFANGVAIEEKVPCRLGF